MIKMSRKAKKAMAVALTAGMLASTAVTPVMAATQGWKQNSKGWWYQNADGSYPANKWSQINGKWYYFDANGYMLANKWVKDKAGKWYFVGANGAMKTNSWAKDKNGLWYWLTDDGSMFEGGWARINGEWYFFKNDGVMQSGVVNVDGETYYLGAPEQGWMQTGTFSIAGTEYNFDAKSGACTSEKAPAASKYFDGKGNEVTPSIDVEEVAGITGEITNALPDCQEKYGNVLIAGKDAYLKVLVTDSKGKPVANTAVSLTVKHVDKSSSDDFDNKGLSVQTTDANGYATFVIGAKKSEIDATSNKRALLSLTATVVATNQTYETSLAFASVDPGHINVINDDYDYDDLLQVPSTNAPSNFENVSATYTIDGQAVTQYVTSQQVNDVNKEDNRVELEVDPKILIPVVSQDVVSDYYQEVNKEIKEYTVYQDGGETSFRIDDIPAGLKYAQLTFSSASISEYTKVIIETYNKNTNKIIDSYSKDGRWEQKDFKYSLPVQTDADIYVVVKVISEGQVNDDVNAGLVIKEVTGVYAVKDKNDTVAEHLKDCVKWETVTNEYSDIKTLSAEKAKEYIPTKYLPTGLETSSKYWNENYKYTYQIPVFPYTGNAIMTVTDANKKVVGYFTIPTVNKNSREVYKVGAEGFQNENILVDANHQAVLVSKDEAFNNVGTIKTDGNRVIVNSEKTGITALQAKLSLPGFEDEIDLTNNNAYTSIQWAPIPNVAEKNEFYALAGQNVTVKAQLVDKHGNPVSGNQGTITFNYTVKEETHTVPGNGAAIEGTAVNVIKKDTNTDANGQATLKLNSADETALLASLSASSSEYDVMLSIGGESVETADIRWVKPGLAFTSAPAVYEKDEYGNLIKDEYGNLIQTNKDYVKVSTLKTTTNPDKAIFERVLKKDTGDNWIFGYEVVGQTQGTSKETTADREVLAIEGLKVELTKSNDGEMVTEGMANGTAKLTSKNAGGTKLTGTINKNSLVKGTDVYFYVDLDKDGVIDDNEKFKNVGEDTAVIDASLELPITWGVVGEKLSLVSPKGEKFVVNQGAEEYVYVKLADAFGGAIKDKEGVKLTITYTRNDGTTFNGDLNGNKIPAGTPVELNATTDANGLVKVQLYSDAGEINNIKFVTITATYNDETLEEGNVITYNKDAQASTVGFALVNAVYTKPDNSNATVELSFTNKIDKSSITKDMFSITGKSDSKTSAVLIQDVTVSKDDDKKVIVTLANENATLDANSVYTVAIDDEKEVGGIQYALCDVDGKGLTDTTVQFTTTSKATALKYEYTDTDGRVIAITSNNLVSGTAADNKFVIVYSGTNDLVNSAAGTIRTETGAQNVVDTTNGLKITLKSATVADGDITIYHNGGSVTISKDTINKKIQQCALDKDNNVESAISTAAATEVSFVDITGYHISAIDVTEGDSADPIFEPVTTDAQGKLVLKTKTPVPDKTATVIVTYTSDDFSDVKRIVKYTVAKDTDNAKLTYVAPTP